jgi:hypothetical protein
MEVKEPVPSVTVALAATGDQLRFSFQTHGHMDAWH